MEIIPTNLLLVFCVWISKIGLNAEKLCQSPQYLDLYSRSTVNCAFQNGFFGVFWYNSSNYRREFPLITYQESEKEGVGLSSGEFDVHLNGSLIIRNVTLQHEHSFAVAYLYEEDGTPETSVIEIVVVVRPLTPFPVVNQCKNGSRFCTATFDTKLEVICNVQRSRPPITLRWLERTPFGDRNISSETRISKSTNCFNSYAASNVTLLTSSTLSLFVCKALNPAPVLPMDESLLIVYRGEINGNLSRAIPTYFKLNSKLELSCTTNDLRLLLWKRARKLNESFEEIAIASFIGENFHRVNSNEYSVGKAGSLIAKVSGVQHEGFYSCWYIGMGHEGVITYKTILYVDPFPSYLDINGCNPNEKCVIYTEPNGNVTCSLKGVRPEVRLTWKTFFPLHSSMISLHNEQLSIARSGDVFDVYVTSYFKREASSATYITVVCAVAEPYNDLFNFTSEAELRFVFDVSEPNVVFAHHYLWGLIGLTLIVSVSGFLLCHRKFCKGLKNTPQRNSQKNDPESEMEPMIKHSPENIEEKTALFIKQLKTKYGVLYNSVQPIPYIKDRMHSVDKVFVEGGIEHLKKNASQSKSRDWRKLDTYQNILKVSESVRLLLEGDPGYGKSTLLLQLAYDWCNSLPALNNVQILVLLQLRQLGCVKSIYEAIARFLLPLDTSLNQNDVEDILIHSNATTFLFDGYDEYPGRFDDVQSDIMQVIEYEMFQDMSVVLTTRSSVLPTKCLPHAERLRLSGFDGKARRYYINKAVVGEDDRASVDKVEKLLLDNPVVGDLCQVPLLFVAFAHMTHEDENFVKLNSATKYFRYMISTFHSHMRNKMNNVDAEKYEKFENKHDKLDKVAFEALVSRRKTIVWRKEELANKVGQDLCDVYIRVGILVEEEVLNITDHPKTLHTTHIQYRKEVRFYHKMFCEWYAAYYVATKGSGLESSILGDFLSKVDPFEFQYAYRFACGLNDDVAKRIIKYLPTFEGGEQFAVLCILEHTGKIKDIQKTVLRICKEGVIISRTDTLLLQRSSIQLLEGASKNKMPIKYVKLHDCITSVDLVSGHITLDSGLHFSNNICTEGIGIDLTNKNMTEESYDSLLQCLSTFPSLKLLSFDNCIPPQSFSNISCLKELGKRNMKVEWQPSRSSPVFLLNLQSGQWEDKVKRTVLTSSYYKTLELEFSETRKNITDEIDKEQVTHMRAVLRRLSHDE